MGDSPDDIIHRYTAADHGNVPLPVKRAVRQLFLVTLTHSTGSILDIVHLAMRALDPTAKFQLPDSPDLLLFRNRIAHLHRIEAIVQRSSGITASLPAPSASSSAQRPETAFYAGLDTRTDCDNYALHQVPASPWVVITDDDEAISHLVSLFLAWVNPGWRFVEQDLFLQGMRSGDVDSPFCSPFLVNAMCSMACLHSEHDIAFTGGDRDRFTRGQHFHNQALRLWYLEQNRATVANIQALCMLSFDSNYRAKDNQGLGMIPMAIEMDNELPFHRESEWCAQRGIQVRDYARARLAAHWTAICLHINMRLSYMLDMTVRPRSSEVPKIHNVFQDDVDLWIGYPLSREAVPHRSTLYLREKCALAALFHDMHSLIFSDRHKKTNTRVFMDRIDQMSTKMASWHERLPFELQYEWPMCVAVWELHASYTCFCMSLRLVARNRCLQDGERARDRSNSPDSPDPEDVIARMAHDSLSKALSLAYKAAQMLRDHRERYGLKISPPWLVQLSAVAAGVLVLDKDLTMPNMENHPSDHSRRQITDSHTAFDEVFRCLLGAGVEIMIARGIARMIYHTALEQRIVLSRSSRAMLQIMADTALAAFRSVADAVDLPGYHVCEWG
ncbi:hypothetical protein CB0940_02026 [Cercospora beticola]|uniref:Xylanolytic transcriptional activator regulatory domain-containing protein n=1 Tax=Cercospora beticola TaxID=122368 RepID=A0A2G5I7T9_CERBT|nr:hypothetical protein CB0940_02026 [Cercospora beticola]PIB00574.1 hypothetical protein CB0940_02026 [Cercospora beticola]WPA97498.1 hypothetical protein RHO25_002108 [Cercospora beticola]